MRRDECTQARSENPNENTRSSRSIAQVNRTESRDDKLMRGATVVTKKRSENCRNLEGFLSLSHNYHSVWYARWNVLGIADDTTFLQSNAKNEKDKKESS